jgi:hypothetical protein
LAAIVLTALYALHGALGVTWVPAGAQTVLFAFLPIVLPVAAAAFISLVSINDLHRRVARYREMALRLGAGRREIAHSQTRAGLERAIPKAERALVREVLEWHSITSFTESH